MQAGWLLPDFTGERKVRAPTDRALGNSQAPDFVGGRKVAQKLHRPDLVGVRVKSWGKSPRPDGVSHRGAKPRPEQGRIEGLPSGGGVSVSVSPGWPLEPDGNIGPRGMAIAPISSGYRTRLIGLQRLSTRFTRNTKHCEAPNKMERAR